MELLLVLFTIIIITIIFIVVVVIIIIIIIIIVTAVNLSLIRLDQHEKRSTLSSLIYEISCLP